VLSHTFCWICGATSQQGWEGRGMRGRHSRGMEGREAGGGIKGRSKRRGGWHSGAKGRLTPLNLWSFIG